ncbi:hypothetical protein R6Q57_015119 [Mikania cordata]
MGGGEEVKAFQSVHVESASRDENGLFQEMKFGDEEDVKVKSLHVINPTRDENMIKIKKKKKNDQDFVGCWNKWGFIGSCVSSRSKVDSSTSGISTHFETKATKNTSKDQQEIPIVSPTPTSNGENKLPALKPEELKVAPGLRKFAFNDLKLATRNFRPESLLGEGGFGCVFKGWIEENGTAPVKPGTGLTVAVKTLNHDGLQGHKEWLAEVNFLGDLVNPNLVKLIGYCIEDDQRLLVYEFLPRGSLENHLFRRSLPLPWSIRMKIALGAAKGLAFLHEEAKRPVIYRDFKTSNILLDAEYNAKLSDFGLAKDGPEGDKTHISTRVMGTYGYAAPEYVMTGHLSTKSDVYSFGVVLLEMLTGRRSMDKKRPNGEHNLVEWARPHLGERRRFYRLIDPRLEGHFSVKGAQKAAQLAARCLGRDPKARPLMSEVVECLKPLPALKDMAGSSYYLQIMQPERVGANSDPTRMRVGSLSRNGHPHPHPRTLLIPHASPNQQESPKPNISEFVLLSSGLSPPPTVASSPKILQRTPPADFASLAANFLSLARIAEEDFQRLPAEYVSKHMENKIPNGSIIISVNGGYSWRLKIKQIGDDYYFTDGWKNVVKDIQLGFGDFLIFQLVDPSTFNMLIHNPNGCHKLLSPKVDHQHDSSKKNEDDDPLFTSVITKTLTKILRFPAEFATLAGMNGEGIMAVKNVDEREWVTRLRVEYSNGTKRYYLSTGWGGFRRENHISEGDECLFKFIGSEGKLLLAKVTKKKSPARQAFPSGEISGDGVKGGTAEGCVKVGKRPRGRPRKR